MSSPEERARLIADGTRAAYDNLDRLDAAMVSELESLYLVTVMKLQDQLLRYGEDGYFSSRWLKSYLGAVRTLLVELAEARVVLFEQALVDAASVGASPAAVLGLPVSTAVAGSVRAVQELVLADGLQVSDRFWRVDREARRALGQAVKHALATGENPLKAARALLQKGEGIPADLLEKMQALGVGELSDQVKSFLMTGKGNALYNVQRVFQTEMARAHGMAYVKSNESEVGLVGFKFNLSPLHRKVDICDELARANRYGLGAGVYPADKIMDVYPAHPNTRSWINAVYE